MQVKLTGLSFLHTCRLPFLYVAIIFPVLHSYGSVPNSRLALKSMVRGGLITSINSLSPPGVNPIFSFWSFFMTLSTEMWIWGSPLSVLLGINLSYTVSFIVHSLHFLIVCLIIYRSSFGNRLSFELTHHFGRDQCMVTLTKWSINPNIFHNCIVICDQ